MAGTDRIEKLRDISKSHFVAGTPIAKMALLIADELEQQRLRTDGLENAADPGPFAQVSHEQQARVVRTITGDAA